MADEKRPLALTEGVGHGAAQQLAEVIYIDSYGNLYTGLPAAALASDVPLTCRGACVAKAQTFCKVPSGTLFGYQNSLGLVEIAANRASAAQLLGAAVGDAVQVG